MSECSSSTMVPFPTLQWRHNGHDGVSNHQPRHCLLNRSFGRRAKKTSNLDSLAFLWGIHRGPVNSPHKWPVTRKMFPFDDVIMSSSQFDSSRPSDADVRQYTSSPVVQIMACRLFGAKPLFESMLPSCLFTWDHISVIPESEYPHFQTWF